MNAVIDCKCGPESAPALWRQVQRLACFGWPLCQWASFAFHSDLFSYVLLIPFISAYLIWSGRKSLGPAIRPCLPGAAAGFIAGAAILAAYWIGRTTGWLPARQDYLALMVLCYLCWFWGACLAILGSRLMGQLAFPAGFLLFMVPLPVAWLDNIDTFLQYTSAAASAAFFGLVREPLFRDGLNLHLSGFSLRVAPECSGIHSTMVLLITSVLAAHLFLRRFWTRAALVLAVIPLAILRNGFRVFVIGELCVHKGPEMIHSPIHTQGGPIFFALSLIPFFVWLVFLRKQDSKAGKVPGAGLES
jgi:exosortase C (VPDSG-CTERM-specific)